MDLRAPWSWQAAAVLQAALALVIVPLLAFTPPEHGRTLLIPLDGGQIGRPVLDRLMLTPVRPGPLAGSLVVEGRGRALAGDLFGNGILMLSAASPFCGGAGSAGGDGNA